MQLEKVLAILEQHKARDIVALDIQKLTDMADTMIICTGTSAAHVQAIS